MSPHRLIAGLGNPILGDDSIGIRIADELRSMTAGGRGSGVGVEIISTSLAGFRFLDLLRGFTSLSVIDAMSTGLYEPGHLVRFELEPAEQVDSPPLSIHHFSLTELLQLGRSLSGDPGRTAFPEEVVVYGIEIHRPDRYTGSLSPALERELPTLIRRIAASEGITDTRKKRAYEKGVSEGASPGAVPADCPGGVHLGDE